MTLTGTQFRQIQRALLDAFGNEQSLRQMVYEFSRELSTELGGQNLKELVYNLVTLAEQHDQIHELIHAAVAARPSNNLLKALQQDAQKWDDGSGPVVVLPPWNRGRWVFGAGVIVLFLIGSAGWFLYQPPKPTTAVAQQLVYEGEQLAAQDNFIAAGKKFTEALALNPPLDTHVYVWIPEGKFLLGSDEYGKDGREMPLHEIDLSGFWIMRSEVTNAQYGRCVAANGCILPVRDSNSRDPAQFPNHLVSHSQ